MTQLSVAQNLQQTIQAYIETCVADALQRTLTNGTYAEPNNGINAEPNRTLDIKEASEYLGVSDKMLYRMCDRKQIPHWKMGKRKLFSLDSLRQWCKEQEQANYQPE